MNLKIKKRIVGVVLATMMIVPTVASAATSFSGGIVGPFSYATYVWAQQDYKVVYVGLTKCGQTVTSAGWQSANTTTILGYSDCSFYAHN